MRHTLEALPHPTLFVPSDPAHPYPEPNGTRTR